MDAQLRCKRSPGRNSSSPQTPHRGVSDGFCAPQCGHALIAVLASLSCARFWRSLCSWMVKAAHSKPSKARSSKVKLGCCTDIVGRHERKQTDDIVVRTRRQQSKLFGGIFPFSNADLN